MYTSGTTGLGAGFLAWQMAPQWAGPSSNYVTGPIVALLIYGLAFYLARRDEISPDTPGS